MGDTVVPSDVTPMRERMGGSPVALKLKLTMAALGVSPKDLCNRFVAVNARTAMTQQNVYKWLSGRATPRLFQVYDDWARVLGDDLTGAFIAAASVKEFARVIADRFAVPGTTVERILRDAAETREEVTSAPASPQTWSAAQLFLGRFVALSPAWSPAQSGKLILGHVEITQGAGAAFQLAYSEQLFGHLIEMTGALSCDGRTAQSMVMCRQSGKYFFFALQVPPPPASLICGVFAGSAIHDATARPVACRIVFVRDHSVDAIRSERQNYMDPSPALIAGLMADMGYGTAEGCSEPAEGLRAFLMGEPSGGLLDAPLDALGRLGMRLDYLAAGQSHHRSRRG
ncbi:hypothetical protein [Salinarimonas soli]|uniref:Uncharacterized protein n=1 Tax=Salinarimonas soli TaxID=1638099 RepID=A0A5B2VC98_9HYPH|nr:hypothetical protein [Salinarimonas soli]KAA2235929.1 hypothetical protein F0L46_17345 [Salinarimonas soli]